MTEAEQKLAKIKSLLSALENDLAEIRKILKGEKA
jgi:hypothetical protein